MKRKRRKRLRAELAKAVGLKNAAAEKS